MLVLTRKQGESITIGEAIRITVVEVRGGQIRLGIDAPRDMNIRRDELQPMAAAKLPTDNKSQ